MPTEKLKPGDLVGVNKDNYLILEMLPAEYVVEGIKTKGGDLGESGVKVSVMTYANRVR